MSAQSAMSGSVKQRRTVGLFGQFDPAIRQYLAPCSIVERETVEGFLMKSVIADLEGIVLRSPFKLDDEAAALAVRLKWIVRAGSGTDNISALFNERGIVVRTTPINAYSVAELVLALTLALLRNIRIGHDTLRRGLWCKHSLVGHELRGKTVGILGFGRIGREVSLLMHHLGTSILAYDRTPTAAVKLSCASISGAQLVELDAVLARADIVVSCLPSTTETSGLFDKARLQAMRPGAVLINVGRGSLIDIEALTCALECGWLGGAALDVFSVEPPGEIRLLEMNNVLCTPHLGAQTRETHKAVAAGVIAHLRELLPNSG
jgi:D-3-phosphoglycerate dehydrogenase / 2-oxoglutarate reductase